MGDLLSPTRLYWNGTGGCARCDGVRVELRHPPRIAGFPQNVSEVEYAPGEHIAELREKPHEARRDMTPDEMSNAYAHLKAIAHAARGVVDGAP